MSRSSLPAVASTMVVDPVHERGRMSSTCGGEQLPLSDHPKLIGSLEASPNDLLHGLQALKTLCQWRRRNALAISDVLFGTRYYNRRVGDLEISVPYHFLS